MNLGLSTLWLTTSYVLITLVDILHTIIDMPTGLGISNNPSKLPTQGWVIYFGL